MNAFADMARETLGILTPPPDLSVSEWADQYRKLSRESSAQSGQWHTRAYQREPMDSFTDPAVHTIVLMVARQTLKTEVIKNCLGYVIAQDPGPVLLVQFRDTDCKRFSKIRLAPMLRDTPCLHGKVSTEKSRSGDNTVEYKAFPGGHLSIVASGSPGNLSALPIRFLFCDEIDKYPPSAGSAGDPISLAQGRQEEFWNRKTVLACTPTIRGVSRIGSFWELSDQREYEICCPMCGEYQIPEWARVRWDSALPKNRQASSARYYCSRCEAPLGDVDRWKAINTGRYRATAPFNGVAGFRVSGLARLGTRLSALVQEFQDKAGSPETLKTFINEQLADLWEEKGEAPDWEKLMARREDVYRLGQVPPGVLFLTAGVDVQQRWIEGTVYGWGRGKQRWVVDHWRIEKSPYDESAWADLTEHLNQTYRTPTGGDMAISRFAVDSGHATQEVYAWARQHGSSRVMAVDGRPSGAALVGAVSQVDVTVRGRKIRHGAKIWPVNVNMAKSELYGLLGKERPENGEPFPPGWIHFPSDTSDEFFKQLTAEQLLTHVVKGYRKTEWIKTRERNEALDMAVYARAAASVFGMDRHANDERWWASLEAMGGVARPAVQRIAETPAPAPAVAAPVVPAPAARVDPFHRDNKDARAGGSWLGGRGGRGWLGR
jgi:phage terminase large subunit GpA-like protein